MRKRPGGGSDPAALKAARGTGHVCALACRDFFRLSKSRVARDGRRARSFLLPRLEEPVALEVLGSDPSTCARRASPTEKHASSAPSSSAGHSSSGHPTSIRRAQRPAGSLLLLYADASSLSADRSRTMLATAECGFRASSSLMLRSAQIACRGLSCAGELRIDTFGGEDEARRE